MRACLGKLSVRLTGFLTMLVLCLSAALAQAPLASEGSQTDRQLPVRGVIRAANHAAISSEMMARVIETPRIEGDRFSKGDVLIRLDCRRQIAEVEAAEAYMREMELALKSATYLYRQDAGSQYKVDIAQARADRAGADRKSAVARLRFCEIHAPYDGVVSQLSVQEHEIANPGKPLISIVSREAPSLELIVPSMWLTWVKAGVGFDFFVDETQKHYPARVTQIGATVDSVSQTVKLYAAFAAEPSDVLPGMSGTASFE
ncbi:efflux RND transporter periplasmic adaptor subunit [uncultured Cohaesibacter sp.]|uniref:efflux RND transporter periplasmic adaptor subunit n=1 Tax=uncultured Cohaesibacter sp. TaxID=1002546 RepID=UPI0029C733BE|nr:efflux RND transporter periplasmic adaptor subunit [uncultured Cohaesibacter sp.]